MLHDMGLTASRVVLFDLPVLFDLDLALQSVALPFRWRPDNGARVGLPAPGRHRVRRCVDRRRAVLRLPPPQRLR